jgi:hypothetical protein
VSNASRIHHIIRNRALIGEKIVTLDGETYALEGYYPALLSQTEFAELQHMIGQRGRRSGKGEIPNLLTGMRLTYCGYCGKTMAAQNIMARNRKGNGLPQDGHRRLHCLGKQSFHRCNHGSSSIVPVERALMHYCSDQMNLDALLKGSDKSSPLRNRLALARQQAAKTQAQLDRITEVLLTDEAGAPATFMRKARELEDRLTTEQGEVASLERELDVTRSIAIPAASETWADLAAGVEALDFEARTKARQLVADTFSRIEVYNQGFEPRADRPEIDLLLVAKRGTTRMLHIDRTTGAWRAQEDVDARRVVLPKGAKPAAPARTNRASRAVAA